MLRKLMLVLGGAMLALTIALPASASHAKPVKPVHPTKVLSAHALCMQAIAKANKAFKEKQRAATKALHADQKAAMKALHVPRRRPRGRRSTISRRPIGRRSSAASDRDGG